VSAKDPATAGYTQVRPGVFMPTAEVAAAEGNPFHPANHSSDPARFYVPPPKAGDGQPASAKVTSQTLRLMQEMAASGRWPFKTQSDIVRAAVHWFLYEVALPMEPRLSDEIRAANEEVWLAQREKELSDYERQVGLRRDHLLRVWKLGLVEEAVVVWERVAAHFCSMGSIGEAMWARMQEAPELQQLKAEVERRHRAASSEGESE
jgi:hypothetical protein